ncbi:MAG: 6-carboxytetrahydropterin synthase QueD, partial [Deltaproteobacteria bacterium]|nr:6-carboxytetrahydropterin synthase QueD [Deltaproteobacteria bacterium]
MYELKVVSHFSGAHQLRDSQSKCEQLHGHNWKVEVFLTGPELNGNGLLIDFRWIKEALEKILDLLDHRFLNDLDYFRDANPSSENIAKFIFSALAAELNSDGVRV